MKMIFRLFPLGIALLMSINLKAQSVMDIDGNRYTSISIGSQSWLKENLKTTRFRNGDSIPTVTGPTNNDSSAVFQWAYNQDTSYVKYYGRLYTWLAAKDPRGACPLGWHLPSQAEWDTLANFLGGSLVAGNHLKDTGTAYWDTSNIAVTNYSGFTGRGSGFRGNPQGFKRLKEIASFWSSSSFGTGGFPRGITYSLYADNSQFQPGVAVANFGACVRCIKDQSVGMEESKLENKIQVYPNPFKSRLILEVEQGAGLSITIWNVTGRKLFEETRINGSLSLDTREWGSGLYIVQYQSQNGESVSLKILKP